MAKGKRGRQSPERYVEGMVELIAALSNIRNGGNGHAQPDPTINVKEQLSAATGRIDDLADLREKYDDRIRKIDQGWQERFDAERERANKSAREAEASRIDNKLSDVVRSADLSTERLTNAATILANTVATTADTAQKALVAAAQQQSELVGQVRDTVAALQSTVTSFIATGGGERLAKAEAGDATRWQERQRSQRAEWQIGLFITAGIAVGGVILKALGIIH